MGVRAGTLECGEGARSGGMEERWESGLEPWSVGSKLGVEGWRRKVGVRAGTLKCEEGARVREREEGWELGLEPWSVGSVLGNRGDGGKESTELDS